MIVEPKAVSESANDASSPSAVFADFSFQDRQGNPWRLSDHRGKVVVVNYWATWCPPCIEETPDLVRLANRAKDVEFVGISIDYDDTKAVDRFVERYAIPYPILMPKENDPVLSRVTGVPETYVLDRSGKLTASFIGAVSARDLEQAIKDASSIR